MSRGKSEAAPRVCLETLPAHPGHRSVFSTTLCATGLPAVTTQQGSTLLRFPVFSPVLGRLLQAPRRPLPPFTALVFLKQAPAHTSCQASPMSEHCWGSVHHIPTPRPLHLLPSGVNAPAPPRQHISAHTPPNWASPSRPLPCFAALLPCNLTPYLLSSVPKSVSADFGAPCLLCPNIHEAALRTTSSTHV